MKSDQLVVQLQNACSQSNIAEIKSALSQRISPDACDECGVTPLCIAASAGQIEAMKCLIDHGANINAVTSTGYTPLMLAVLGDKPEAVKLLLDQGADPGIRTTFSNFTAQDLANLNNHPRCMTQFNVDVDLNQASNQK